MKADRRLVLSCEHGGCEVPAAYRVLFRGQDRLLRSHRGCDPGSLELAEYLAAALSAPLIASTVTRLLVELNRSVGHPRLFSWLTQTLDAKEREAVLREYYKPHRALVEKSIKTALGRSGAALHLGVHTFTPVMKGSVRRADIGLLYDPSRKLERSWATAWRAALRKRRPDLVVRRNYPYLGVSDGLTTSLRRQLASNSYAGLELEVNQRWFRRSGGSWEKLKADLTESLREALASLPQTRS
ncbi:MAG: N-formylglutamate amidohydrolase [Planctomycetes bacterium]|nr:N-formylglutamate amidohydrolase [Planctomycetota bacterium]